MLVFLTAFAAIQDAAALCSHDLAERGLAESQQFERAVTAHLRKRQNVPSPAGNTSSSIIGNWPDVAKLQWSNEDPTSECTVYSVDDIAAIRSQYPPTWQIAQIVDGDVEAISAYNAIINHQDFPSHIQPKGTTAGDFTGVQYNASDPDCWWSWGKCTQPKVQGLAQDIYRCPEPQTLGFTVDDGPNCSHNAYYDYLREKKYKGTLFYVGSNVLTWSYQARRGLADGHEIGVHTWSHRYSTALTNQQFFAELWYSRKIIKHVLGITPRIWRAPFGDVDDRIRFIAASLNLATVGWSDDTFDYKVASMTNPQGLPIPSVVANYQAIAGNSTSQAELQRIGNIVLTHELNNVSMLVAVQQLPSLFGKFKHVMPVSSCMNVSHPYDEQSWTYALFNDYVAGNNATNNGSQALDTSIAAYTGGSATSLSPGATTLASSEVVGSVVTSTNIVAFPTAATGAASPAFVIQSGFAMGIAAVSGLLLIATV